MELTATDRLLVPIANEDDARRTCTALDQFFTADDESDGPTIVAIHVIQKGGGAIDKAPMDARTDQAEAAFEVARATLEPAGYHVETELLFGTDVVDTILEATVDLDATAIAFLPREGGLLVRLLTGNVAKKLIMDSPVPVLTFPAVDG